MIALKVFSQYSNLERIHGPPGVLFLVHESCIFIPLISC